MIYSLQPGQALKSLDQVSTAIPGKAFAVPQPPTRHGGGPREVTWSYEPGANKPSAIVIELRGALGVDASDALVNPVVLDTYNVHGTATVRTAEVGKMLFLALNILSITIGTGDPIDGEISL